MFLILLLANLQQVVGSLVRFPLFLSLFHQKLHLK